MKLGMLTACLPSRSLQEIAEWAAGAGFEALQVEINRALYLDESTLEPSSGFEAFQAALAKVIAGLAEALVR